MRILVSTITLAAFVAIFTHAPKGQTTEQGCAIQNYKIVSNFDVIKAGEVVSFEVQTKDGEMVEGDFAWSVSIGKISNGQGTSHIKVQTPADALESKPPEPSQGAGEFYCMRGGNRRTVPLKITAVLEGVAPCAERLSTRISIGSQSVAPNRPGIVTELLLDKTNLTPTCEPSNSLKNFIDIFVRSEDPESDVITYHYTVTAGKIVGVGAEVKWDLSDVSPGEYSITAGVDDGCGICGKTVTKKVTVAKCF